MLKTIKFYSQAAKDKVKMKSIKAPQVEATATEKNTFLDMIHRSNNKAICRCTFDAFAENFFCEKPVENYVGYPQPLKSLLFDIKDINIENILENMIYTNEQIKHLEEATMKQADSILWHEQRIGRITASKAHLVLHTNNKSPFQSLLKSIYSPIANDLDIPAMKWGRHHENDAIAMYKRCLSGITDEGLCIPSGTIVFSKGIEFNHSNPAILSAGLLLCKENPWLGASPDAYLVCECCEKCVLEVKCPFKWANEKSTLSDMLTERSSHLDESGELKKSHK